MKKKKANIYDAVRAARPEPKGKNQQVNKGLVKALAIAREVQERYIASNERIASAAEAIALFSGRVAISLEKIASAVDDERFLRIIFSSTSASGPKKPE